MILIKVRWFSSIFKKSKNNLNNLKNINNINSILINKKNQLSKPENKIIKHNLSESHSSQPYIVYKKPQKNN
tara:strand:+ start:116 stop:331 length:216 start_codon:yes stop_codon:yes gene_type:complete